MKRYTVIFNSEETADRLKALCTEFSLDHDKQLSQGNVIEMLITMATEKSLYANPLGECLGQVIDETYESKEAKSKRKKEIAKKLEDMEDTYLDKLMTMIDDDGESPDNNSVD